MMRGPMETFLPPKMAANREPLVLSNEGKASPESPAANFPDFSDMIALCYCSISIGRGRVMRYHQ